MAQDRIYEGWKLVEDDSLTAQLLREIKPGHALHGILLQVMLRATDCDDVLAVEVGTDRAWVVHLTWSDGSQPPWPQHYLYQPDDA